MLNQNCLHDELDHKGYCLECAVFVRIPRLGRVGLSIGPPASALGLRPPIYTSRKLNVTHVNLDTMSRSTQINFNTVSFIPHD